MAVKLLLSLILLAATLPGFAKESEAKLRGKLIQLEEMIAAKHARDHRRLQSWLKNRQGKIPKTPNSLLKAYYYLGTVNAQIWMNYPVGKKDQDEQRYRRARSFLEVCSLYEYEIDKVEARLDKIEQLRQMRIKQEKVHHWRVTAQFISYQESAFLNTGSGEETIYSTQRGPCLGMQWGYGNAFSELTMDACYYNVRGNVESESSSPRYFQRGIGTQGFLLRPAYWKMLNEGEAAIGLGVTAMVRKTDYTEPAGTSIKSRLAVPYGLSLEGRWRLSPRWNFTSSMGYMDASLLWAFGGAFEL